MYILLLGFVISAWCSWALAFTNWAQVETSTLTVRLYYDIILMFYFKSYMLGGLQVCMEFGPSWNAVILLWQCMQASTPELITEFTEDAFAQEDRICKQSKCQGHIWKGDPCHYIATYNTFQPGKFHCLIHNVFTSHSVLHSLKAPGQYQIHSAYAGQLALHSPESICEGMKDIDALSTAAELASIALKMVVPWIKAYDPLFQWCERQWEEFEAFKEKQLKLQEHLVLFLKSHWNPSLFFFGQTQLPWTTLRQNLNVQILVTPSLTKTAQPKGQPAAILVTDMLFLK
ncbi:hypothetical protein J3A83DRAFT_4191255 [Scleroderma citrinum]